MISQEVEQLSKRVGVILGASCSALPEVDGVLGLMRDPFRMLGHKGTRAPLAFKRIKEMGINEGKEKFMIDQ
jgi:hypothetical protein